MRRVENMAALLIEAYVVQLREKTGKEPTASEKVLIHMICMNTAQLVGIRKKLALAEVREIEEYLNEEV